MKIRQMRNLLAIMLVLLPTGTTVAQTPTLGGTLAEHWCMGCHVVEPEPPRPSNGGAPSFSAIAAKPSTTAATLDRYLSAAHTHMPDFALSRNEREAIIDYILSLRPRRQN